MGGPINKENRWVLTLTSKNRRWFQKASIWYFAVEQDAGPNERNVFFDVMELLIALLLLGKLCFKLLSWIYRGFLSGLWLSSFSALPPQEPKTVCLLCVLPSQVAFGFVWSLSLTWNPSKTRFNMIQPACPSRKAGVKYFVGCKGRLAAINTATGIFLLYLDLCIFVPNENMVGCENWDPKVFGTFWMLCWLFSCWRMLSVPLLGSSCSALMMEGWWDSIAFLD